MTKEQLKFIIEKIQAKDSNAFGELFDFYYPKILNYSLKSTMDVEHSKDITSNTFIKILNNINNFTWIDDNSCNGWIYRIATNEINQFFRKQNKYKLVIDEFNYSLSDDNENANAIQSKIDSDNNLKIINNALSTMNTDFQNIIRLRYFEELSYEEIARIMNKNESTIRVYSKRAKEKLKELININ